MKIFGDFYKPVLKQRFSCVVPEALKSKSVKNKKLRAACKVTVKKVTKVKKITLNTSSLTIPKEETRTLWAAVKPSNATYKTVVWGSG